MYMKNLNRKMTLRLTEELNQYVTDMAEQFSISPSDFIRQCIAQHKDSRDQVMKMLDTVAKGVKEGFENGLDRKTDEHNKL